MTSVAIFVVYTQLSSEREEQFYGSKHILARCNKIYIKTRDRYRKVFSMFGIHLLTLAANAERNSGTLYVLAAAHVKKYKKRKIMHHVLTLNNFLRIRASTRLSQCLQ